MRVKNPNITGIIHSNMRLVESCWGDAEGIVVIFWRTYIDTPTSRGRMIGDGSGRARSIHRKRPFSGTASWASERPE